jgi:hypothetical protein
MKMRLNIYSTVLAGCLACAAWPNLGCTVHARYYDSYHHDYHDWNGEVGYYSRWETETHRDHVDFKKRNKDDQKAYWDWRHDQH